MAQIEGRGIIINGGTFNNAVSRTALSTCFDKLAQNASPQAFHLADSDLSHSTCFPNTRTKILERIKGWALRYIEKDKFVMWLHGPAGGGKTAIGRTIAKWCEEEGILLGEFFFSRADGTGAQIASLAPTLAYRMAVHTLQDAKEAISDVINRDPHIFLAPLAIQLKKLVMEPLNFLASSCIVPYVIVLDGIDETLSSDDQHLLLNVISEILYQLNPTLRILICCRPEPAIVTAFNDTNSILNSISTIISLNDDVDADADIRAFLVEKFARTKNQLPHPPNGDWPTPENIDYLVKKSSGQFIFAATVERYVCSPTHRHQAVARLKHVLDLRLLPHLEDKERHPFAVLDALYYLILRTRSDVDMSVHATAVCLEYPKYFIAVSPVDVSKVLNLELSETWAMLYELASLFDTNEESIRPFHASLGDFLFDSLRSADFFRNEGDIAADITCAMLRQGRDPEVLSYRTFSNLLREATPRQDLRDALCEMKPASIFRRPANTREYKHRFKGAYYLIPLLRQLGNHVPPNAYNNFVAYFDQQFKLFLPLGYWSSNFSEDDNDSGDGDDADTDDDHDHVGDDDEQVLRIVKAEATRSLTYMVTELLPLSTSSVWDEINAASPNIFLTGSDSLMSFCDEAHFARSHLKETLSALLEGSTQAKAALFCLEQIQSDDITEDLKIAFAKLLPHSLLHAENLPELTQAKAKASLFCLKQIQSADITEDLRIVFARLLLYSLLPAEKLPELTQAKAKSALFCLEQVQSGNVTEDLQIAFAEILQVPHSLLNAENLLTQAESKVSLFCFKQIQSFARLLFYSLLPAENLSELTQAKAKSALFCLEQVQSGNITEDLQIALAEILQVPHSLMHAEDFPTQAKSKASLFCFKQIQSEDITEDLRIVFARLLLYSLLPAENLPELTQAKAKSALFCVEQVQSGNITEDLQIAFAEILQVPHSLLHAETLPTQAKSKASLFCFKQIQSEDITEDLKIAFARLLPHLLLHAERLPELTQAKAKASLFCLQQIQSADITEDLQVAFARLLPHSLFQVDNLPELTQEKAKASLFCLKQMQLEDVTKDLKMALAELLQVPCLLLQAENLPELTQAKAKGSLFCLKQIQSEDITEDLKIAFARLLPHSLFLAKNLPELTLAKAEASLFCFKQIQSEKITEDLQIAFTRLLPYSLLHAENLPELTQANAKASLFCLKQIQSEDITEDLQVAFASLLTHSLFQVNNLPELKQEKAKASLFCLKQIQSEDITEDLQIAFARLLPYSLFHAENLPELTQAKANAALFCLKQIQSEDATKDLQIAFSDLLHIPHLLLHAENFPELMQAKAEAALFCLEQIQSEDTTEDLQIAFARLLPHSLLHVENLPELTQAKANAALFCLKQIQSEDATKDLQIAFSELLQIPHLLLHAGVADVAENLRELTQAKAKASLFCLEQIQSEDITKDLQIAFARLLPRSLLHAVNLPELTQAKASASLFCLKQIQSEDITEDLRIAFAKLLPRSLFQADNLPELTLAKANASRFCLEQIQSEAVTEELQIAFAKLLAHLFPAETSPELRNAIQQLEIRHVTYRKLPEESRKAILVYLVSLYQPSTSKSVPKKSRGFFSSLFQFRKRSK